MTVGSNKLYDGLNSAGVTFTDSRVAGDSLAVGGSAIFGGKNAGSDKSVSVSGIRVVGADAGNYTCNSTAVTEADISKANLTYFNDHRNSESRCAKG